MEREWLEHRLTTGRSYGAIAREAGCHASTVSYWAQRYGLRSSRISQHTRRGQLERKVLCDLVDRGLSVRQIAAAVDRSGTTVRHWLRAYGLDTRRMLASKAQRTNEQVVALPCPRHGKTHFVRRNDSGGWRCVRCRTEAVRRRRKRVKEILVHEAGGRCSLCGYDRYIGALAFHHRHPAAKRSSINRLGTSLGRARVEAQKCVLLCTNCHAEVEAGITRLSS